MDLTTALTTLSTALIGAGVLTWARDAFRTYRQRKNAQTPEAREALHVATADQTVLVLAKARDDLAEDNVRVRATLAEERNRHDAERREWMREKREMRDEIDVLSAKLRGLLREVEELRTRHSD